MVEGEEALGDVLVIIDSAGVFRHRVIWCTCGDDVDQPMQLFQEQLFPATYCRPKSAFTFNLLDQFYIDAMECKTTAMSFFQKLCRLTDNAFPDKVHVRKISFVTSTSNLKSIYLRTATEN
jgi:CxC2 like cysteine cluster associated with KDZ transposases